MPLVQAQATRVLFALREAGNPNNPVLGATFTTTDLRVAKATDGLIANATNQAATVNGGVDGGIIEVPGVGMYSILLTAGELTLGLAAGAVGIVSLIINKTGAVPLGVLAWEVQGTEPGALTTTEREAVAAAVVANASFADLPTNAELAAAIAPLATAASVDSLPTNAELTTALDALPTAAENATAVGALAVDGARTLAQAVRAAAAFAVNRLDVPMTAAGGSIVVYAADGVTVLFTLAIDENGARTVVP